MKKILRLLTIYRVANRYRLGELLEDFTRARFLPLFFRLPRWSHPPRAASRGERLRLAMEELGPIFIKFGQLLSTRRDVIPEDLADELAKLQDDVPPFDGAEARQLIEAALDDSIDKLFAEFSTQPLASASVAQVHAATLPSGEDVVVKVIRPGIEKVIAQDLALLKSIAALIENNLKQGKRLRAAEVVRNYEYIIQDELNLLVEGANTTQLRRNFENSALLHVPKIYWEHCRLNVLVMERVYGIPVNQVEALKAAGINLKRLAEVGVEIFFTQVFEHSFFHADMHPGNVYVSRQHPENPQYIALDCAIIGTLSKDDQYYLARNLLAIFKQDYRKVAELHVECGWVPADTPVHAFETTMRSVCEPSFQKPLRDISFATILLQLFRTASRFNMEVQPSLVLLQKTLVNIEGLGKQLYPELDLWQTFLPFLEKWQQRRFSPLSSLKRVRENLPEWLEQMPEIPQLLFETMRDIRHARDQTQALLALYEKNRQESRKQQSRWRLVCGLLAFAAAAALAYLVLGE